VVQFAGDSVTAVFAYEPRTRGAIVRRALQCGLDMQEAMGSFQETISRAGMFRLAMRFGLGAGPLPGVIKGDPAIRLAYAVMVPALELVAAPQRRRRRRGYASAGGAPDAAHRYAGQGWLEEAGRLNEQALEIAARRDDREIQLRAQVLAVRVRVALGSSAVAYREAYERLTETRLPPGPPLPALPEVVAREPVEVEELLREVDLAIKELRVAEAS
jgi:hypothetical protein